MAHAGEVALPVVEHPVVFTGEGEVFLGGGVALNMIG